jgi:hypothetical protein
VTCAARGNFPFVKSIGAYYIIPDIVRDRGNICYEVGAVQNFEGKLKKIEILQTVPAPMGIGRVTFVFLLSRLLSGWDHVSGGGML